MTNYIKYIAILFTFILITGCGRDEQETSKTSFQILADKEKELTERENRIKLREAELELLERKILNKDTNFTDDVQSTDELTNSLPDTIKVKESSSRKRVKKEIQKEISSRFENPTSTVRDYYEYIQRGINEEGNFDSNMKKAQRYFPSRTVEKLKSGYRNTKQFTVISEPQLKSRSKDKAVVVAKVRQVQILKKDGTEKEVTKNLTVTYNLSANKDGEWVIVSNSVKEE
jgi:hypothetical protein